MTLAPREADIPDDDDTTHDARDAWLWGLALASPLIVRLILIPWTPGKFGLGDTLLSMLL